MYSRATLIYMLNKPTYCAHENKATVEDTGVKFLPNFVFSIFTGHNILSYACASLCALQVAHVTLHSLLFSRRPGSASSSFREQLYLISVCTFLTASQTEVSLVSGPFPLGSNALPDHSLHCYSLVTTASHACPTYPFPSDRTNSAFISLDTLVFLSACIS